MRLPLARTVWSLVAPLGLLGLSCGGSDGDSGGGLQAAAGEFAARYAEIFCAGMAPCCQALDHPHDLAACRDYYELHFRVSSKLAEHFDSSRAEQCLKELEKAVSTCAPEPGVCNRVFSGNAGPGEECHRDEQCAQPANGAAFCEATALNGAPPVYICRVVVPAAEGQPCASPLTSPQAYECNAPAFYCDDAANVCHLTRASGAPCGSDEECGPDAVCTGTPPTCLAKVPIGGSCAQSADCTQAAYCSGGKCSADKAAGEPCDDIYGCAQGFCNSAGKCQPNHLNCIGQ